MTKIKPKNKFNILHFIGMSILFLAMIKLLTFYWLSTDGEKIRQFENKAQFLEAENHLLMDQINQTGSLSIISSKAEQLGFVRTTRVVHLSTQLPVALRK